MQNILILLSDKFAKWDANSDLSFDDDLRNFIVFNNWFPRNIFDKDL